MSAKLNIITPVALALVVAGAGNSMGEILKLNARKRVEESPGTWKTVTQAMEWEAGKSAIVVCDMWDRHWCPSATARVAEMAPRMNDVLCRARDLGVFIIHCPSETMDYYKDWPQRARAQAAPKVKAKVPLKGWCGIDPDHEPPLPIDDSDGGCDAAGEHQSHQAWSKQIEILEIHPEDAITDSFEAYYLMEERGIENVIVLGVHVNMCVLGRPFSIRQMVYQGKHVVLMRDMTDSMYNPAMPPHVSHFEGTDLVVEHIEKYWVPSITSADILGGNPFRFQDDPRVAEAASER